VRLAVEMRRGHTASEILLSIYGFVQALHSIPRALQFVLRAVTCCPSVQVDALIIGGNWGKKDRSGMLGEYVLGLADGPAKHSMSPFLSFCR